jgi:signal transduction histidine kinase
VEAQEASQLREQFIGVLGHDLRNPLGALSMGIALVERGPISPSQAETMMMMRRNVTRMTELIGDAMDFTRGRLGGGISVQRRADQPLEPVLRHVIEEVQTNWPEREIQAAIALPGGIAFDRQRLVQLFTNLLTNAMSYGQADRPVRVGARVHEGEVELSVANSGPPIPHDVQQRLFEPFSRAGEGRNEKGLGLGLYIASEIAKSHGGRLGVVSDEVETCFTLRMPINGD